MKLTAKQEAALRSAAEKEGVDPDELIAAADADDEEEADAPSTSEATAPKIFQYHLPFMTVEEVRASIGLKAPVVDGAEMTGPWLAKHGGQT